MKIAVDKNAPIPAYKQVVDGIAEAIGRGDAERGSRLPSVRNLAHDLGLNVNTVARAYRDLERAGVIRTMPGMGSFVPEAGSPQADWSDLGRGAPSGPAPAIGGPRTTTATPPSFLEHPVSADWRGWLAAAHSLARAEGLSREDFLEAASEMAAREAAAVPYPVVGASPGEAADLLRCLPTDVASDARVVSLDELGETLRAQASTAAVLTSFPSQSAVRSQLEEAGLEGLDVVPVETEYSEATVKELSGLSAEVRLALVTVEKEHWDNEANDVMKIIGRSHWLKMVFLEHGERGLLERLGQVEAILHVPRARTGLESIDLGGRRVIELQRQVTARTRHRLESVSATHGA